MSDAEMRDMTASDRRFVVPTWALGARWTRLTKGERFARVDALLDAGARVSVLASGNTVHAWAATAGDHLLYVYVPPEIRGEGLARRVITHALGSYPERIFVTHPWPRPSERFRSASTPRMRTAA